MGGLPRGVSYRKQRDTYVARITFNKIMYRSPNFKDVQDAADWYKDKSLELYGYEHVAVSDSELRPRRTHQDTNQGKE